MPVSFPKRQLQDFTYLAPRQRSFGISVFWYAGPRVDQKEEAEPILAGFAEARPADGAAQAQRGAFDARLLADLAAHAGDDIFVRIELAAEAVVFAEVIVVGPRVAMDEQHAFAIGGEDVTERRENRREHDWI